MLHGSFHPPRTSYARAQAQPRVHRRFERTASRYWTSDRIGWLRAQDDPLAPNRPGVAPFCECLDCWALTRPLTDKHRKYRSSTTLRGSRAQLIGPLQDGRSSPLRLVDLCTGASLHLAAALVCFGHRGSAVQVLAVDESAARLKSAQQRADYSALGQTRCPSSLAASPLDEWTTLHADARRAAPSAAGAGTPAAVGPPHGVFALHACDTATDEAIAFAVRSRARSLLVAPCCQAYGPQALNVAATLTLTPFSSSASPVPYLSHHATRCARLSTHPLPAELAAS